MKYIAWLTVALIAIAISSCGKNNGNSDGSASAVDEYADESYDIEDIDDEDTDSFGRTMDESLYALKNESFATIQLGMPLAWLPESEDGFYSSYKSDIDDSTGELIYSLEPEIPTDGSGETPSGYIALIGNDDGEVQGISLSTNLIVYAVVNDHVFELPKITVRDLYKSGACRAFHVYWMGLCISTDNMTFFFDRGALSQQGYEKVYADEYKEVSLTHKDFKPSAHPYSVLLGNMAFD